MKKENFSAATLFVALFAGGVFAAFAVAPQTTATTSGNFNDAAIWDNGVPNSTLAAAIPVNISVNVNASVAAAQVTLGGTLNGTGTLNSNLTANSGGTISPGNSLGILTVNGNVVMNANSVFAAEVIGTNVGTRYDQLKVNGTITIDSNAQLGITFGFAPAVGQTFILIDNDGNDAINGTFNAIPQNFQLPLGGNMFASFSYTGGDGNDFQMAIVGPTAASVSVSGRVVTPTGRGLTNATVTMTDAAGATCKARTSTFGYYRFESVAAGQTYIFNVVSKQFQFVPQVVSVSEETENLNFAAQYASLY